MKRFHKCLLVVMLSLFSTQMAKATGGNEGGAGGNGLMVDGTPYLFDFVETGIEKNPYIDSDIKKHPQFSTTLAMVSGHLGKFEGFQDQEVTETLALKLLEIGRLNTGLGYAVALAFQSLNWYQVNADLVDAWAGTSAVNANHRISLAVRIGADVRISRGYFTKLTLANKVGLMIHECIFSLTYPKDIGSQHEQNSDAVRDIVGNLFSRKMKTAADRNELAGHWASHDLVPINLVYNQADAHGPLKLAADPFLCAVNANGQRKCHDLAVPMSANNYAQSFCKQFTKVQSMTWYSYPVSTSWQSYTSPSGYVKYFYWFRRADTGYKKFKDIAVDPTASCVEGVKASVQTVESELKNRIFF